MHSDLSSDILPEPKGLQSKARQAPSLLPNWCQNSAFLILFLLPSQTVCIFTGLNILNTWFYFAFGFLAQCFHFCLSKIYDVYDTVYDDKIAPGCLFGGRGKQEPTGQYPMWYSMKSKYTCTTLARNSPLARPPVFHTQDSVFVVNQHVFQHVLCCHSLTFHPFV